MTGRPPTAEEVAKFQFTGQDLPRLLASWAARQPDKPFLIWEPRHGESRVWTYGQFWTEARQLAAGLAARGVGLGDRVLLHAENCPEAVLAWYACAVLGAVAVTTNTRSVGAEMAYFSAHAGCTAAITQPRFAALVAEHAPGLAWIAVTADDSGEPPAAAPSDAPMTGRPMLTFGELYGDAEALAPRPAEPLRPVGIMFTSGTTSRPKAVVHTHANALWAATVGPANIGLTSEDVYLVYLPFFHVNAQSWSVWSVLGVGATVVLQPKFSASRFWPVVTGRGVTHLSLIPFVFRAVAGKEVPEHRIAAGVFGLVVPDLEAMLGFPVLPAYGMTETVTHAICAGPHAAKPPARSMGRPAPGYEVLVVDPQTGIPCPDGEVGELWVRGTRGIQLFWEYLDDPVANAKAFTDDGWFRTGDMVRIGEDGYYFYCERDSDVLKVGGENVSAREVEDICRTVPGVADVAVVGRSHPMLDQVPVAFVIRGPGADGDDGAFERAVLAVCAAQLADFKVPRAVHMVTDFPRATLDKVAKNRLRDLADSLASA